MKNFSHERLGYYSRRPGKGGPSTTAAIVLILIALGVGILYGGGYFNHFTAANVNGNQNTAQNGQLTSTTLPLQFSFTDPFAATLITAVNPVATVYTPSGNFLGSCTSASGSCTTTGVSFTSGQNIVVKVAVATYVTEWIPITVPFVPNGAAALTSIPVSIYQLKLGSWVTTFNIGGTNAYSGASKTLFEYKYNFTSTASQSVTATFSYKTANTGYLGCNSGTGLQYDVINRVCQSVVMQISDTGSGLSVTGMPRTYSTGSSRYWWAVMPSGVGMAPTTNGGMGGLGVVGSPGFTSSASTSDPNTAGSLSTQTIGNSIYGGTATATFTVQQGSVASGSTENTIITLYVNADPNYFPSNNNLGPNNANASTPFTIVWKAH